MFRGDDFGGNGAGDRIRTGDINLGKVALYQLSYSREGPCISPEGERHHCRAMAGELSNSTGECQIVIPEGHQGLELLFPCGFTQ